MEHLLIGISLLALSRMGRKTFKKGRVNGKSTKTLFAVYPGKEMKMFRAICFLLLIYVASLWYQGAIFLFDNNTFF